MLMSRALDRYHCDDDGGRRAEVPWIDEHYMLRSATAALPL